MKKMYPYVLFALFATLPFVKTTGQSSCPQFVVTSFKIVTDPSNTCLKSVSIDFYNPTNGKKSVNIKVTCANTVVYSQCFDATGEQDVTRNITTGQFICCNLSQMVIEIAAHTGNSTCLGTPCIQLFSIAGSSLPVHFSSFTATRKEQNVDLKWSTATEQNNFGFDIERKTAGHDWEKIAFIPSAASGGNSNSNLSYSYTDTNNETTITNYRLKQTDLDGTVSYSDVRAVTGSKTAGKVVTVFPNPGKSGEVKVLFKESSGSYNATVIDMNGRIVKNWTSSAGNNLVIDNIAPGFYSLRIIAKQTGEQTVEKFIIK
jgi:type IX secretion system substrate protein